MEAEERRVIEDLFRKLDEVERRGGTREPEADAYIAQLAARQPGAAYYMAQAIVAQERALEAAQARIATLEEGARAPQGSGGFLSWLFGVPARETPARERAARSHDPVPSRGGPWGRGGTGMGGGGFLAGAAQTAVGVAGGVMLGSFLADMLTPDAAIAGEPGGDAFGEGDDAGGGFGEEPPADDMGGMDDLGGDF